MHGRFPAGRSEVPDQVVAYVARLVDVPASDLGLHEWDGRTIKAHRADIRKFFGFRECSVPDAEKAAAWLATNVCEKERQVDRVRQALLAHLKEEDIEPPTREFRHTNPERTRFARAFVTRRVASRSICRRTADWTSRGLRNIRVR
ncbi:MAG: transposase Tn3 family protein [Actinomycetia bacterium]|nr:transposase Tn3 family protein [Actinomycetes bacterium]